MTAPAERPLDIFIVAAEDSGDKLGAPLMAALKKQLGGRVRFRGVGGHGMEAEGLTSQFAMEDVTAIGIGQVLGKLRLILRRIRETAAAAIANPPDVLVLVDSPDFTHRVAKRVRRVLPDLPVVKYVSPTVWAWRSGRAPAMRAYVDHILALFPFEPEVHRKLGGPSCTYVGHPLLEMVPQMRASNDEERAARGNVENPLVLVLPGSRRSEITRLSAIFGETLSRVKAAKPDAEFVLPTLPSRADLVREHVSRWPVQPRIVVGEAEKYAAFRKARAALAASGTVTLELALAQVPMVVAYKIPYFEGKILRAIIKTESAVLANILLNESVVPEFLQLTCTPANLSRTLLPLLDETPERQRQLSAFSRLDEIFDTHKEKQSDLAARTIIELYQTKTGRSI